MDPDAEDADDLGVAFGALAFGELLELLDIAALPVLTLAIVKELPNYASRAISLLTRIIWS
jgi:hypothetical protein